MDKLELILKHKWYDMIAMGKKPEEYRELTEHYKKMLEGKQYDRVRFHRGYTSTTITYQIREIVIGRGNPEWGAPDRDVYIIRLGQCVGCSA